MPVITRKRVASLAGDVGRYAVGSHIPPIHEDAHEATWQRLPGATMPTAAPVCRTFRSWAASRILSLQRRAGNAAVGEWLEQGRAASVPVQRSCACDSTPDDRCDSCETDQATEADETLAAKPAPVQRYADCTPPRMSLEECPRRAPGEKRTARTGDMVFLPQMRLPGTGETGVLIANFNIGSATIKANLAGTIYWQDFLRQVGSDKTKWRIEGFSDCQGGEARNGPLRDRRARAVLGILPAAVKARITATAGAAEGHCITGNESAADRTLNRSVALILVESTYDMDGEQITDTRERLEPDTEGCSADQKRRLAVAYPLARRIGEDAVSAISTMERGSPEEALLKKFFGARAFENRWRIKRGYVDALRAFQGDPTYKCVPQGTSPCDGSTSGYVGAHAIVFGSPVVVCSHGFTGDDLELADTILHEASHVGDWTDDLEYCSLTSGCTLETTDERFPGIGISERGALGNADSYARFASQLYLMQ